MSGVSQERTVRDQDIARLQTSLELQLQKQKAREELARLKRAKFSEDSSKRKKLEEELRACRTLKEQAIKVTSLTQQLEQASIVKKRSEDELRQQRDVRTATCGRNREPRTSCGGWPRG